MRSTLLWLMSRSCQRATFSRAAMALPRRTRARPVRRSHVMGLRLCGMALLPFWPLVKGSSTSRTSVRWRWRNSTAQRSMLAPTRASVVMNSAWMSRWTTCVAIGAGRRPSCLHTAASTAVKVGAGADGAAEFANGSDFANPFETFERPAKFVVHERKLEAEGGRLGVNAVAAADAGRQHLFFRAVSRWKRGVASRRQ